MFNKKKCESHKEKKKGGSDSDPDGEKETIKIVF